MTVCADVRVSIRATVAKPEDVANAIAYLASDKAAGHVSGEIIEVTGGMEGRLLYEKDETGVH